MEKYGTDRAKNLINEEANIMRQIANHMTSADKVAAADTMQKLESRLFEVRAAIDEVLKEND